jgi:hypothetical protein
MMLQNKGYGVTELRLWCYRVTVMVLQSNDGVIEKRLWYYRIDYSPTHT